MKSLANFDIMDLPNFKSIHPLTRSKSLSLRLKMSPWLPSIQPTTAHKFPKQQSLQIPRTTLTKTLALTAKPTYLKL